MNNNHHSAISTLSECRLNEAQTGLEKGDHVKPDYIFVINQLTDKRGEFNLLTLSAFLDYDKAFGTVIRNKPHCVNNL
jgi:hypothetical protein